MKETNIFKNIVIGMGPGGLAAAFKLLLLGENVTLIDKQEHFTRNQRVYLPIELIQSFWGLTSLSNRGYLLKEKDDTEDNSLECFFDMNCMQEDIGEEDQMDFDFFKQLQFNNGFIEIKDLQTYQLEKLKRFSEQESVKYNIPMGLGKHDFDVSAKINIYRGKYEVVSVNTQESILILRDRASGEEKNVSFDSLVCADGSKHEMVDLLNESLSINYIDLPKPRHERFGTAFFKLSLTEGQEVDNRFIFSAKAPQLSLRDLSILSTKFGWTHDYFPLSYTAIDIEKGEAYFTVEIPMKITREQNQSLLTDWGKFMINRQHGVLLDDLELANNGSGKESSYVFAVEPKVIDRNYIELTSGGKISIIGDAAVSANLTFGHGVQEAIQAANEVSVLGKEQKLSPCLKPMLDTLLELQSSFAKLDNPSLSLSLMWAAAVEKAIPEMYWLKSFVSAVYKVFEDDDEDLQKDLEIVNEYVSFSEKLKFIKFCENAPKTIYGFFENIGVEVMKNMLFERDVSQEEKMSCCHNDRIDRFKKKQRMYEMDIYPKTHKSLPISTLEWIIGKKLNCFQELFKFSNTDASSRHIANIPAELPTYPGLKRGFFNNVAKAPVLTLETGQEVFERVSSAVA